MTGDFPNFTMKDEQVSLRLANLRKCEFFRDLSETELGMIHLLCHTVEFRQGEALVAPGHPRRNAYLILDGRVGIFFKGYEHQVPIDVLDGGDLVAATALLGTRPVTGFLPVSLTQVRALAINGGEIKALCDELPSIGYRLMSRLAEYLIRRTYDVYEGLVGRTGRHL